ncbi:hypothetical protein KC963_01995 [Candidatus Saccharibacteria bacterium]|nr:hypothetical protein [Candidatus Saccharibacteria bacterium]
MDTIVHLLGMFLKRPRRQPVCSDSEVIALSLIGECKGWDVERDRLSNMQSHDDLFPQLPSQSRFLSTAAPSDGRDELDSPNAALAVGFGPGSAVCD